MNFLKNSQTNWKYILIVVILATLVGGGILWFATKQEIPVTQLPEIKKPTQEKIAKADTDKCLPAGYSIISGSSITYEDVNNDGVKEAVLRAINDSEYYKQSIFICKQENSEYKLEKQIEIPPASFIDDFLIKDLNENKIPEIIYTYAIGAGETMPRTVHIVEWNGKDYEILLDKTMTLFYYGRPNVREWSNRFIRDLNNNGKFEIIIPTGGCYQVYCKYPKPGCVSLLNFDVYEWDGKKYIEATSKFLKVYDEEIKLAEEFLKDPKIQEDSRKRILEYLKEINNLKETVNF